jgi:hypothetical protein
MLKSCGELSLAKVEADVQKHIQANDFGQALDAIRDAVDTVINNRRSVARVYASNKLDQLCVRVAQALQEGRHQNQADEPPRTGTVIMATELAAAGGHVEVIKDLVRVGGVAKPVQLLLTNNFGRIDTNEQSGHAASMHIPMTVADGSTTSARLNSLIAFLQTHRPHTLVLLVHNQDAIGIAAALLGLADKVLFVHHGDHHLSLGVTCDAFTHVDLSNHSFFYCRRKLGVSHNVFWPLTLANQKIHQPKDAFLSEGHAVTCAVGRPEKFDDHSYQYQYLDLVGLILASTNGRHVHIGPLSPEHLARIHGSLKRHHVDVGHFVHIPWVASVSQALLENGVDVYMTSFPYGGGKSQVEAMATGIPVLIHRNYRSQFLSGIDMGYPNVMSWSDELELQSTLQGLTPAFLKSHSLHARHHFERHHAEDRLIEAIASSSTDESTVNPLAVVHDDGLQAFLDEEAELIGAPLLAENVKLTHMLEQQIEEAAKLHTQLAQKNEQMSRMGLKRNMLKALLTGRRLKP